MSEVFIDWQLWLMRAVIQASLGFTMVMGAVLAILISYWIINKFGTKEEKKEIPLVEDKTKGSIREITGNHLQLLAYHYLNVAPYAFTGTWGDTCYMHLLAAGLLQRTQQGAQHGYCLTERGTTYVEDMLHVPIPLLAKSDGK